MEALPSELLDGICTHLDFNDLKTIRLLNKSFANHVTPRLFFSAAIWLQQDSVAILTQISQHKHLREHVKHLRIAFELFLITDEDWGITYCGPELLCEEWSLYRDCGGCDCDKNMTVEEGQHILQDQKWIDNPSHAIKQLGTALRNLPNLTSVEISGQRPKSSGNRRLINPVTSMYGNHSYADWYALSGKKQFEIFMLAVVEAGQDFHLTDLTIRDIADSLHGRGGEHLPGVHAGIISSQPKYIDLASLALHRVEKLKWSYPIAIQPRVFDQQKGLNGLLSTMPLLKEMSLSDSSRHHKQIEIPEIFGSITWEGLHTIRFHKMQFLGRELYEFVGRHSSTLRFFDLGCARIIYPTFKFFLLRMKELCGQLEKFVFSHDVCLYTNQGEWKFPLWYGGDEEKAKHQALVEALDGYVTGRVDAYPCDVLRRCMQRNKNQYSYNPVLGIEFAEDESEDEGAREKK